MNLPLNSIICGDCLEVMKTFEDKSVDLVLTDPPYGIGIAHNPIRQMHEKKDWDDATPKSEYFSELFRISENQIIWGGGTSLICLLRNVSSSGIKSNPKPFRQVCANRRGPRSNLPRNCSDIGW